MVPNDTMMQRGLERIKKIERRRQKLLKDQNDNYFPLLLACNQEIVQEIEKIFKKQDTYIPGQIMNMVAEAILDVHPYLSQRKQKKREKKNNDTHS